MYANPNQGFFEGRTSRPSHGMPGSFSLGDVYSFQFFIGFVDACTFLQDTIHDEEYILRTYDYPILGKVPDLLNKGSKSYGYYYRKHRTYQAYQSYQQPQN